MRRRWCWRSPPHLAAWAKTLIDGVLTVAGTSAAKLGIAKLAGVGVMYQGLAVLGGGSILAGLTLAAIAVFVIERDFMKASAFSFAGAVMTYFGFMHGSAVGIGNHGLGVTPGVAFAYLIVAVFLFALGKKPAFMAVPDAVPNAVPAE